VWKDGHLDRELNRLNQTLQEQANLEKLIRVAEEAAAQCAWIDRHADLARRVDQLHAGLARAAPKFRRAIARTTKGNLAAAREIEGHGFTRGSWRLVERLEFANRAWIELQHCAEAAGLPDGGSELEELAPRIVRERLAQVERARLAMKLVHENLSDASAFLSGTNVQRLGRWGRRDDAPIAFAATHTGARVKIRCGMELWEGPVGLPRPAALPGTD
jgi:GAF domain-containing protein